MQLYYGKFYVKRYIICIEHLLINDAIPVWPSVTTSSIIISLPNKASIPPSKPTRSMFSTFPTLYLSDIQDILLQYNFILHISNGICAVLCTMAWRIIPTIGTKKYFSVFPFIQKFFPHCVPVVLDNWCNVKALLHYATCVATCLATNLFKKLELHDQGCYTMQRFLQLVSQS